MNVTVQYLGQLGQLAGRDEEPRTVPDGSLVGLLATLATEYGESFSTIVLDGDAIRPSLMVLVNDAPVDKANPPAVNEGDTVTLLPAISGG